MNEIRFYPMCLLVTYFHIISFILPLFMCFLIVFFEGFVLMNLKTCRKYFCVISMSPKMRTEERKKMDWKKYCNSDLWDCCNMQHGYEQKKYKLLSTVRQLQMDVRVLSPPRFFSFKRSTDACFTRIINVKKRLYMFYKTNAKTNF